MKVKWKRGKKIANEQVVIFSACERFQIFRFEDWYAESRAVWVLRDDGEKIETYDRLRDAKDMAAMLNDGGEA